MYNNNNYYTCYSNILCYIITISIYILFTLCISYYTRQCIIFMLYNNNYLYIIYFIQIFLVVQDNV